MAGNNSDDDLYEWLEILSSQTGPVDEVPERDGWDRTRRLELTERSIELGWVQALTNRGDDRLQSARDITVTEVGRSALRAQLGKRHKTLMAQTLTIEEKRARRFAFMREIYQVTDGSRMEIVDMFEIGEKFGWDQAETSNVVDYLASEGLLEYMTMGGGIGITHAGAVEVEESVSHPEKPTHHFPPVNLIHIGSMVNSSLIQDSAGSHQQNVTIQMASLPDISNLVTRFLADEVLSSAELTEDDRDELRVELQSAQLQLQAKQPKLDRVRESMARVAQLSAGAALAGGGLAKLSEYAMEIHKLVPGI